MAAARPLLETLHAHGPEFDFFQAVVLVESSYGNAFPASVDPIERLGESVRFRTFPSLNFPPSSLARVEPPGGWDADRPELIRGLAGERPAVPSIVNTFFGLVGPNGTLPMEYTELLCRLERDAVPTERTTLRDWFDLLHHRMTLLFYCAWEKYRFPVSFRRGHRLGRVADPFTQSLRSLIGLGTPALRSRVRVEIPYDAATSEPTPPIATVSDIALLRYAGILARRIPTALGLRAILTDYFGVGVELDELTGQWLSLSVESQTQLVPEGACTLGQNAIAGERIWDAASKFRLTLGPLNYRQFEEFLPDPTPVPCRKGFFLLCQVVRLYVGPELDWEVRLRLRGNEVPSCQLSEPGEQTLGPRLGWNCWLPSHEIAESVDEAMFDQRDQVLLR